MNNNETKNSIPFFSLYGESTQNKDPGFVHIEDISIRSSAHNWEIKPHRHGRMVQLLCMFDGELDLQLDDVHSNLLGSWVITIPAGVVHGFRFRPDTEGVVITIAEPLLNEQNREKSQNYIEPIINEPQVIEFNNEDVLLNQIKQYASLASSELQSHALGQHLVAENLVCSILIIINRQLSKARLTSNTGNNQSNNLVGFRELLETHYRDHWKVKDYANALHTSPSSLNRLCNTTVGSSAKSMIQERLLIEAKRRLIYTREPLDQIAYKLGFKDPAYFSRFFRNLEKVPPSDYRKNENYDTQSV